MRTVAVACLISLIACGGRHDPALHRPRLVTTCFQCPGDFECIGDANDGCTLDADGECGGICVLPRVPIMDRSPAERSSALGRLAIAEATQDGYEREQWQHWIDADQDCQDTRQEVLVAESQVPVTFADRRQCKVARGQWLCPFTGETFTDPSKLDVNHMVPLGAADEAGGYAWDAARRQRFANELDAPEHLVAVKAAANRSKGNKGPDEWLPANEDYLCQYLRDWIRIKARWHLTVTPREKQSLESYAARCDL